MGSFHAFLAEVVRLIGVEAGGTGTGPGEHGATLCAGTPGVLHGALSYLLQDEDGQIEGTHSVSAGLDYPGVGPEHSMLKDTGRVEYHSVGDAAVLDAFFHLSKSEGIVPALESSHALSYAMDIAGEFGKDGIMVICLSGRGDKDVAAVAEMTGGGL